MCRPLIPVLFAVLCWSHAAGAELLVPAGAASTWEYRDGDAWHSGPAPLGYGRQGLGTVVSFGKDPQAKPITTYFRRAVDVPDPSRVATLVLRLLRDDGAVIRWNGVEIVRSNLPDGVVGPRTPAVRTIAGTEQAEWRTYVIPTSGLPMLKGRNALAVEIHQAYASSSDIVLDLELTGYGPGESTAAAQQAAGRDAATDEIRTAVEWIHAKVAARRDLPIRPQPRPLPAAIPEAFRPLVDTPPAQGPLLQRADMLADLDDLELLLENCYAYLALRGVDYRGALDAVRASITDDLPRATFVLRLSRLMAIFGDLHSIVWDDAPHGRRADLRFVMADGRLAAIRRDRSGTLVEGYPYVMAINGRPAEEWLAAAERLVIQGSPQIRRALALSQLEDVATVARQMGVDGAEVRLTLASSDGVRKVEQRVSVQHGTAPSKGPWPWTVSQVYPDNIGYLRLVEMRDDPAFVASLHDWMRAFRDTRGLVIDLRGNVGGSQDALQALMPWLMRPGSPMKIVNVAAYRLPVPLPGPKLNGFLGLDGRGLYPATSSTWTAAQAAQVRAFLQTWRPSWQLPEGKFSAWHVMGITPRDDGAYYGKPVVVLVDEHCASAGDNFAGAVKGLPGVTLMGTPTAGTSGRRTDYVLPHSGVTFTLAQMASFKTDGDTYEGHGVTPDVFAAPTLDDQLLGRGDSVLRQAVARLLH